MIKKYLKIWWLYAVASIQIQLNVRWGLALFLIAKLLRFATFTLFLVILLSSTKLLAGYNLDQTILFFLSFNLLDILSQLLFREVYRFRGVVLSGSFDFYLIKPINPLFRSLLTGPDLLDFVTLLPLVLAIIFFINKLNLLNFFNISLYLLMLTIGFITAFSLHVIILSVGILTTEIDNVIMVYRDIIGMGRVPVDIYAEPVRGLITFIVPVAVMMAFPAKSLLGMLSFPLYFYAIFFCVTIFFISMKFWQFALKRYSSASS